MNTVLLTNVLAHYRVRCFERLSEMLDNRVRFYFLTEQMPHRDYVLTANQPRFPAVYLPGWGWHRPPLDDRHLNNILPIIRKGYDTVVLGGWDEPTYILVWLYSVLSRKKVLFWIESTALDAPRSAVREQIKRMLLGRASGCIVPGRRAKEYCASLGMPEGRIFTAPNAADHDFFQKRQEDLLPMREKIRDELGLSQPTILFVGRLVEQYKAVSTVIEAYGRSRVRGQATLLVVGDGPNLDDYRRLAADLEAPGIRFMGERRHNELCRLYAAADIMVLPSASEPWGFVLNEAMEFGLPLVVSDAVGAGPDLVADGQNGFVFPCRDHAALAPLLERLVADSELRRRLGDASRRLVAQFTPDRWAAGAMAAIQATEKA